MSMKCGKAGKFLSGYLHRQLSSGRRTAVERHLESCRSCRDELDRLAADEQFLRATDTVSAPPYLPARVMAEIRSRSSPRPASSRALGRLLTAALSALVIVGSACAGVVLGSSMARFGSRYEGTGFGQHIRGGAEQKLPNSPGQEEP